MKAILSVISAGLTLTVWAAAASAGAPLGPAMATLEKGDVSLAFEYAYENMTLSADGSCLESVLGGGSDTYKQKFEIDDLETNMFFARLTYALTDRWDVYLRLGAANGEGDLKVDGTGIITGTGTSDVALDGSYGFAGGVGTRATFWTSGPWSIAGSAQATWFDPDHTSFRITEPATSNETILGHAKIDYFQTQFSLAAVYQQEPWGIWAGPFVQLVDGDLDLDADFIIDGITLGTISCSADVEEESQVGVHAGAALALSPNLATWIEGQYTSDSWLLGIGAIIRPQ